MAIKLKIILLLIFSLIFSQGCGLLYSNVVMPQSIDFDNTPVGTKSCELKTYGVKIPQFLLQNQIPLSAKWSTDDIRREAKNAGIKNISFTEVREFSLFFGSFSRSTLVIYGN